MGKRKRQRINVIDDWQQLQLLITSAARHLYELIRPIVLFGYSPAERACQTGAAERTLYRHSQPASRRRTWPACLLRRLPVTAASMDLGNQ